MQPMRKLAVAGALVGLSVAGGAVGATYFGTAGAATSTTTTPSSSGSSTAPAVPSPPPNPSFPAPGSAEHEAAEKPVTGDAATKAQAAAVKHVGSGTAGDVTTDFRGDGYEVTVTKSDGTQVEVHLDSSFTVMMGHGGPGGHGCDGDGNGRGSAGTGSGASGASGASGSSAAQ